MSDGSITYHLTPTTSSIEPRQPQPDPQAGAVPMLPAHVRAEPRKEDRLDADPLAHPRLQRHDSGAASNRIRPPGNVGHSQRVRASLRCDQEIDPGNPLEPLAALGPRRRAEPGPEKVSVQPISVEGAGGERADVQV